jgi:hypothetical protein
VQVRHVEHRGARRVGVAEVFGVDQRLFRRRLGPT